MPNTHDNLRLWLDVPFAEKDEAKKLGARWEPQARSWYAPPDHSANLVKWKPLSDLLPGEDRDFGSGLFVDLVPSSCWFTNVRSCVSSRDWDRLRLMIYRRAEYRCEACGSKRDNEAGVYLEAHERWAYLPGHVQVLKRLICLCTPCHEVTHFGFATVQKRDTEALRHLIHVNNWQPPQGTRPCRRRLQMVANPVRIMLDTRHYNTYYSWDFSDPTPYTRRASTRCG